jgi:hypothetical protein
MARLLPFKLKKALAARAFFTKNIGLNINKGNFLIENFMLLL